MVGSAHMRNRKGLPCSVPLLQGRSLGQSVPQERKLIGNREEGVEQVLELLGTHLLDQPRDLAIRLKEHVWGGQNGEKCAGADYFFGH